MIRGPPRSTQGRSSAASDVYKRQAQTTFEATPFLVNEHVTFSEPTHPLNCAPTIQSLSLIHISEPTRPY